VPIGPPVIPLNPGTELMPASIGGRVLRGPAMVNSPAPFWPLSIPNLLFWMDFSDLTTINVTGGTMTVLDKSGNARSFTATGTAVPNTGQSIHGVSALGFASPRVLICSKSFSIGPSLTVFSVAVANVSISYPAGIFSNDPDSGSNRQCQHHWTLQTSPETVGFVGTTPKFATGSGSDATIPHVFTSLMNSGAGTITNFLQGVANGSTSGTGTMNTITAAPEIGKAPNDGTFWNGNIGEVFAYNGALATSDRQNAEKYLMAKWGLF
jgi:hypothetical protein